MKEVIVAPSLLGANLLDIENEVKLLNSTKAEWLHLDVMDGSFVENISFGMDIIKRIKPLTDLKFDIHLMVINPFNQVVKAVDSGADFITIHIEAIDDNIFKQCYEYLNDKKIGFGLAVNPDTEIKQIEKYLDKINLVLVMSVFPGKGGQTFISNSLTKVTMLVELKNTLGLEYKISIDGGINDDNFQSAKDSGVDVLVSGSYLFSGDIDNKIDNFING